MHLCFLRGYRYSELLDPLLGSYLRGHLSIDRLDGGSQVLGDGQVLLPSVAIEHLLELLRLLEFLLGLVLLVEEGDLAGHADVVELDAGLVGFEGEGFLVEVLDKVSRELGGIVPLEDRFVRGEVRVRVLVHRSRLTTVRS